MGEISTLFLVLSLFLPRTTLFLYYFFATIPPNTVPLVGDVLLGIFLPRGLILVYIAENLGMYNPWFWIHLVVAMAVYLFSGNRLKRRRKRR